ncbi:hypothetical protein HMI54_014526 [Coelomomyces lativittatus]|nr:hypothetical protein HMI54_014526 [Coelomomyces lativittatus]KAJ1517676.1 hypothetical protein HMI55_006341 [Coelomomyces lativittatus]
MIFFSVIIFFSSLLYTVYSYQNEFHPLRISQLRNTSVDNCDFGIVKLLSGQKKKEACNRAGQKGEFAPCYFPTKVLENKGFFIDAGHEKLSYGLRETFGGYENLQDKSAYAFCARTTSSLFYENQKALVTRQMCYAHLNLFILQSYPLSKAQRTLTFLMDKGIANSLIAQFKRFLKDSEELETSLARFCNEMVLGDPKLIISELPELILKLKKLDLDSLLNTFTYVEMSSINVNKKTNFLNPDMWEWLIRPLKSLKIEIFDIIRGSRAVEQSVSSGKPEKPSRFFCEQPTN